VRQRRIEPLGGPEQLLGALRLGQLVQQHAGQVEQHRLARLTLERVQQAARGDHEDGWPQRFLRWPVAERQLRKLAAGLIGALLVGPAVQLIEQPGQIIQPAVDDRAHGAVRRVLHALAPAGRSCGSVGGRGGCRAGRLHRRGDRPR
jgi:hypothetical protein